MRRLIATVTIAALCGLGASASAGTLFTETFDSHTYEGTNFAWWDTTAGELKVNPLQMVNEGDMALPGWSEDIVLRGDVAFVAAGASGMHIVDISNPASPTLITTYALTTVEVLDVEGDVAATGSSNSFRIVDITGLTPGTLYAKTPYDAIGGLELVGNRAYLALNDSLRILDISNRASPKWMGSVPLSGDAYGIAVQGDYAYCARGSNLSIVDISNPTNPTVVAIDVSASSFVDVVVDGDYAYATIVDTGVRCFYVGDPTNPQNLTTYSPGNFVQGLTLSGSSLYVGWRSDGLIHLDISVPYEMVEVSTLATPGVHGEAVAVSGRFTYLADGDRLSVVSNASSILSGEAEYSTVDPALDVAIQGTYAYIAEGAGGLTIVEHAPASDMQFVANVPLNDVQDVAVVGDYAFVANGGDSFEILDVSDPSNPSTVFSNPAGVFTDYYEVVAIGDLVYLLYTGIGTTAMQILDVTDPAAPVPLDTYVGTGFSGLSVEGGRAALGSNTQLLILSVRNPSAILTLGGSFTSALVTSTDIEGDVVYAAGGTLLQSYDISNPSVPVQLDTETLSGSARGLSVEGNIAWVASDTDLWQALTVTDPSNLGVPFNSNVGDANAIVARGDQIYMATDNDGLVIWRSMSRRFDDMNPNASSTNINPLSDLVVAARVTHSSTPAITMNLTNNGGSFALADSASWVYFGTTGSDVRWRATLNASAPEQDPVISELTVEMLYEFSLLQSITDVGNDQGRNVRLTWERSGYDYIGSTNPIVEYDVYRKQAPGLVPAMAARKEGSLAPQLAGWDYVTSVPARADEIYSAVVPTLADSTDASGIVFSTFMVRAVTAAIGVHYDSYPDSGYSVDNLAPMVPANALAAYNTGSGNQLSWDPPLDEDFQYFRIYRDTDPNFAPGPGTLVDATTANGWTDPSYDTGGVFYKISAVDFSGNESDFAAPNGPTVSIDGALPTALQFYPGAPNPFRSATTLRFALPVDASVELSVYDITGRRVRSLAEGAFDAGIHTIRWDGRDDAGRTLPPGLYLTRFIADGEQRTGRIVRVE